jgi:hypothetical protein
MGYRKHVLIFLLSAVILSCTEQIDVKLDENYSRLVVDGSVTTDTMKHRITLSLTSDYFYDSPPEMVSEANVTISDGTSSEILTETAPGTYFTNEDYAGVPGKTYTLNINLRKPVGGFNYYTASSTLLPVFRLDSIGLEFIKGGYNNKGIWVIKSYFSDPPTRDYYRVLISRNSEMITDTLSEWYVTDDIFFNGRYSDGLPVGYLLQGYQDNTVESGDTITAEINGIEKQYEGFILDAQAEIRGFNPLFSGPSANVKGNISNGAIGFFAAYSVTRASAIVPPRK